MPKILIMGPQLVTIGFKQTNFGDMYHGEFWLHKFNDLISATESFMAEFTKGLVWQPCL